MGNGERAHRNGEEEEIKEEWEQERRRERGG